MLNLNSSHFLFTDVNYYSNLQMLDYNKSHFKISTLYWPIWC